MDKRLKFLADSTVQDAGRIPRWKNDLTGCVTAPQVVESVSSKDNSNLLLSHFAGLVGREMEPVAQIQTLPMGSGLRDGKLTISEDPRMTEAILFFLFFIYIYI